MLHPSSKPELKRSLYSLMLPDGSLIFVFTPHEPVVFPRFTQLQRELLLLLDGALSVRQMTETLRARGMECSQEQVLQALNVFNEKLLLEERPDDSEGEAFTEEEMQRYNRQHLFFAAKRSEGRQYALELQGKFKSAHIALFGLGGFGSHIFYALTAAGIGKLTVVDFDNVEYSNLNRQSLYLESDVGRSKIHVARERSRLMNSLIDYTFIEKEIASQTDFEELMDGCHLAVLAADSPRDRIFKWINAASYSTGTPVLYGLGIDQSSIRIGPLTVPGRTACFNCSMPDIEFNHEDPVIRFINGRHRHGVIAPSVMIAVGIMTLEILKHLTGFEPCRLYDRRIRFNLSTYESKVEKIARRGSCPYCGGSGAGFQ